MSYQVVENEFLKHQFANLKIFLKSKHIFLSLQSYKIKSQNKLKKKQIEPRRIVEDKLLKFKPNQTKRVVFHTETKTETNLNRYKRNQTKENQTNTEFNWN